MPIYEYRCESCDHEFEKLIRSGDSEPDACPDCDTESITRLISNTNFQLKGSGWYETDYARADEPEPGPDGESAPEGEADGADESSGDEAESSDDSTDTGQAA